MDQEVTITIKNLQNKVRIQPKRIKQLVLKVLAQEAKGKPREINICFVDDSRIKELNRVHLKKNSATDVLAFDMNDLPDTGRICAEIVVSCETAARNALIFKTSKIFEVYLYLVHGILHILGYRDGNLKSKKLMQDKAEEILQKCLSRKARP